MENNNILYPDIFYQLQPYVMEACDQLDARGYAMPSAEQLRQMGDGIQQRFEMAGATAEPSTARSRGLLRDLLDILLLTELFGRRRRYY